MNNKINLSKEPYKGVRDFYPDEMRRRNYFFGKVKDVVKSFGFDEYDASIMEESALYRAKTGDEIVNEQTYNFIDRGGREVTLRPEMTPSVARMIARKRKELSFPLKWFNIGRRYRYERMQKGRLREFWQLDCDVFGVNSVDADVELISLPCKILQSFGTKDEYFEIRINHRGLTNYLLRQHLKLDDDQAYKISKLIDRKQKMSAENFASMVDEIIGEKRDELIKILEMNNLSEISMLVAECEAYHNLLAVTDGLRKKGIENFRYDPTLMRGFDYYTGVVFEVFDKSSANNRSIFGGGRYDDLVGIFGVEKVAGIGFGMGDVVFMDFLNDYGLLPKLDDLREGIYFCVLNDEVRGFVNDMANKMRNNGMITEVDLTGKKVGDQIKLADKKGRKHVICVGEDEVLNQKFKLKDLVTKEEKIYSMEELAGVKNF